MNPQASLFNIESQWALVHSLSAEYLEDTSTDYQPSTTDGHALRVGAYSYAIAKSYGLPKHSCERYKAAAAFHDIGKLMIPDSILNKPSALTLTEREKVKAHTIFGYELLRGSSQPILEEAAQIALYHHERFDGQGYPHGLKENEIPLSARMTAVADVFDALTTDRVYRSARSEEDVISLLWQGYGSHFDPAVLSAFIDAVETSPDLGERLRGLTAEE